MEIQEIIDIADNYGFVFHEYKENGQVCGYEMEGSTDLGIDMIHFIDCRDYSGGLTPENVLAELKYIAAYFDSDEEVDIYRQDEAYRRKFTVRQSLNDFDDYSKQLTEFVWLVTATFDKDKV